MSATIDTTPRVYLADLAAYNNGIMHGLWVDATDVEYLEGGVQQLLDTSPMDHPEEFAIHDYEGFGPFTVREYDPLAHVAAIGAAIAEGGDAFAAWVADAPDYNTDLETFQDRYMGEYDDIEHLGRSLAECAGIELPEDHPLAGYIDYAGYARDQLLSGELMQIETGQGGIFVYATR